MNGDDGAMLPGLADALALALAAGASRRRLQAEWRNAWQQMELLGLTDRPTEAAKDADLDLPAFVARHHPDLDLSNRRDYKVAWSRRARARKKSHALNPA